MNEQYEELMKNATELMQSLESYAERHQSECERIAQEIWGNGKMNTREELLTQIVKNDRLAYHALSNLLGYLVHLDSFDPCRWEFVSYFAKELQKYAEKSIELIA